MNFAMVCHNCASQEFDILADGSGRCRYCGAIVPGMARPMPNVYEQQIYNVGNNFQAGRKDKVVALIITFFFGSVGGQYFYYGNYVAGIICLLFCWTLIPTIWSLIYFFILLGMSDQTFNEKYNNLYNK